MAKFKPAKAKPKAAPSRGAVPCLVILISGMLLFFLVLYFVGKSS